MMMVVIIVVVITLKPFSGKTKLEALNTDIHTMGVSGFKGMSVSMAICT
jgi:hypothetical protein